MQEKLDVMRCLSIKFLANHPSQKQCDANQSQKTFQHDEKEDCQMVQEKIAENTISKNTDVQKQKAEHIVVEQIARECPSKVSRLENFKQETNGHSQFISRDQPDIFTC